MACNDNDLGGSSSRIARPRMFRGGGGSNVAIFELLNEQQVITTTLESSSSWDLLVLTGPEFESLGKAIQDIVIDYEVSNIIDNFQFFVAIQSKYRNGDWGPALSGIVSGDCLVGTSAAPVTQAAYKIGTAYTDRTRFGVLSRLVMFHQAKTTGGGTGRVGSSARISMQAAVRFWGC